MPHLGLIFNHCWCVPLDPTTRDLGYHTVKDGLRTYTFYGDVGSLELHNQQSADARWRHFAVEQGAQSDALGVNLGAIDRFVVKCGKDQETVIGGMWINSLRRMKSTLFVELTLARREALSRISPVDILEWDWNLKLLRDHLWFVAMKFWPDGRRTLMVMQGDDGKRYLDLFTADDYARGWAKQIHPNETNVEIVQVPGQTVFNMKGANYDAFTINPHFGYGHLILPHLARQIISIKGPLDGLTTGLEKTTPPGKV